MHAPALTVPADTPVAEAVQHMLEAQRKVLPITDAQGHLLGAVDRADLLNALRAASGERQSPTPFTGPGGPRTPSD
jgi:CBS-domain-containing membrane protein